MSATLLKAERFHRYFPRISDPKWGANSLEVTEQNFCRRTPLYVGHFSVNASTL